MAFAASDAKRVDHAKKDTWTASDRGQERRVHDPILKNREPARVALS